PPMRSPPVSPARAELGLRRMVRLEERLVQGRSGPVQFLSRGPEMDRIDGPTLFLVNLLLLLAISVIAWGPGALLVAALIGTPLALGAVIGLSLTAKA